MAKRKLTIPVALVAGVAAGMADPIRKIMEGDVPGGISWMVSNYTGINTETGGFSINALSRGLVPLLMGAIVHKYVGGAPLNVNRALAAAGVPILRI